jgi:hypothetical protein
MASRTRVSGTPLGGEHATDDTMTGIAADTLLELQSLQAFGVIDLKGLLTILGKITVGKKNELVDRLLEAGCAIKHLTILRDNEEQKKKLERLKAMKRNISTPLQSESAEATSSTDGPVREGIRPRSMNFEPSTPQGAHEEVLTLQAIAGLLDEKLAPVTSSVASLTLRLNQLEENHKAEITSTREEMTANVEVLDGRITSVESAITNVSSLEASLETLLKKAQAELERLQVACGSTTTAHTAHSCTAVVGGLGILGAADSAIKWVENKLWWANAPQPVQTYTKGDNFNGLVFAKFTTEAERDSAVDTIRKAKDKMSDGAEVRASPDRPVEERTVRQVLYGAKKLVLDKGLAWESLWVDDTSSTLQFGRDTVLTVKVVEKEIVVEFGIEWEGYVQSGMWSSLVTDAKAKLTRSGNHQGKGKGLNAGKGKSADKGKGGGKPHRG